MIDDPTAFRPMKVTASRELDIGFELEPIIKKVTLDKVRLYTGWPQSRSYHNDYPESHKKGLKEPILLGNQILDFIFELLIKFFGQGYLGGNLSVELIRQMHADDEITTRGVVTGKVVEGEAIRLTLDISCENQFGEKVIVGIASGFVR